MTRPLAPILLLATLTLTGCKPDAAVRTAEPIGGGAKPASSAGTPVDPTTAGSLSGTVAFKGKAPERIRIDMSQDPVCAMTGGDNFSEQYLVKNGKLANVYVYVKSGPAAAMNAAAPDSATTAVLDQKGCQYRPHVVAIVHGGSVDFRNSDPTMHNIHTMPTIAGNEVIDVSQGPNGAPQVRRFPQPEVMMPVRCNNHPWMNAFINIAPTPFFAVTGTDGSFTITGLPAGHYTLAAVHEKIGEQDLTLDITAHAATKAAFTFSAK